MCLPIISETTFLPIRPTDKGLIGFSSFLYDGRLSLQSVSVYTTHEGGIRLLFPDRVLPNGKNINAYYPINAETYELMRAAVAKKVEEVFEKAKGQSNVSSSRFS